MLTPIAPLDYERYAILLSPLLVPGPSHAEVPALSRQLEQLERIGASRRRLGTRADQGLVEQTYSPPGRHGSRGETSGNRVTAQVSAVDLTWAFRLPNNERAALQSSPAADPGKVAKLYEGHSGAPPATVRATG